MNAALFNSCSVEFAKHYDAAAGAGSAGALPPGFFAALIQALLTMITSGGCLKPTPAPADVRAALHDPVNSLYILFGIRREALSTLGRQAAHKVNYSAALVATQATATALDDATLMAVYNAAND